VFALGRKFAPDIDLDAVAEKNGLSKRDKFSPLTQTDIAEITQILGDELARRVVPLMRSLCRRCAARRLVGRREDNDVRAFIDDAERLFNSWAGLDPGRRRYLGPMSHDADLVQHVDEVAVSLERVVSAQYRWRTVPRGRRVRRDRHNMLTAIAGVLERAGIPATITRGGTFEQVVRILCPAVGESLPADAIRVIRQAVYEHRRLTGATTPAGSRTPSNAT